MTNVRARMHQNFSSTHPSLLTKFQKQKIKIAMVLNAKEITHASEASLAKFVLGLFLFKHTSFRKIVSVAAVVFLFLKLSCRSHILTFQKSQLRLLDDLRCLQKFFYRKEVWCCVCAAVRGD